MRGETIRKEPETQAFDDNAFGRHPGRVLVVGSGERAERVAAVLAALGLRVVASGDPALRVDLHQYDAVVAPVRETVAGVLEFGDLSVDLVRQRVVVRGDIVRLTSSEFRLLAYLAVRAGEPCTRREIMRHLWDSEHVGDERACDVHVFNLRRKIERDPRRPKLLTTVAGVGYRLEAA